MQGIKQQIYGKRKKFLCRALILPQKNARTDHGASVFNLPRRSVENLFGQFRL